MRVLDSVKYPTKQRAGNLTFPVLGESTIFPTWNTIPVNSEATAYLTALVNLVNPNRGGLDWDALTESQYAVDITGAASLADSNKFLGGCIYNGYIYAPPFLATDVLKINTANDTYSRFGTVAAGDKKYIGCALSPVNNNIYCAPLSATAIMKINTSNDSLSYFDTTGPVAGAMSGNLTGASKNSGIYQGVNGKLYIPPYDAATSVTVIDTSNDSIYFIDETGVLPSSSGSFTEAQKMDGGVCYGNYIYCSPSTVQYMIKIDTKNDICTRIGSFAVGANKWSSGCLAPNGKIYYFPYSGSTILVLDTSNDTFSEITVPFAGTINFLGSKTMPNGYIYAIATNNSIGKMIVLDPLDNSIYYKTVTLTSAAAFIGGILAPNGAMYAVPYTASTIKKYIVPGLQSMTLSTDFIQSRYNNNY